MSFPKVTIGILVYRSLRYLPYFLPTLMGQNYPNLEILILDNTNGEGEEYAYIKKNYPHIKLFKAPNLGFGGGHNFLIRQAQGKFYLCLNDDMLLEYDFVRELMIAIQKDEQYALATGKIKRWDFANRDKNQGKTNQIDTVGLKMFASHRFEDEAQGQMDQGQYDEKRDIFGASGAAVLFRMEALHDVGYVPAPVGTRLIASLQGQERPMQFFDELMFMYKEDIDLMYRLKWAGWKAIYTPRAVVYHDRTIENTHGSSLLSIFKNRRNRPQNIKEWSYRNHQIMLQKNSGEFSERVRWATAWYQFKTTVYILVFERYLLKQNKVLKDLQPEIHRRRLYMKRRVSAKDIETWMQ